MRKFSSKSLVFVGFLVGVFGLRLVRSANLFQFTSLIFWKNYGWQFLLWLVGGVVGWYLLVADRLLWVYFSHPKEKMSLYIKDLVKKGKFKQVILDLEKYKDYQKHLSFRSALFQVVWVALAFFTITSTPSFFGKGLVMALGLHLLIDEWEDQLKDPNILNSWLFWQIKRKITLQEQKTFLWLMTGLFFILTILMV